MPKRPLNMNMVFRAALQDDEFLVPYSEKQRLQYWELINNLSWLLSEYLYEGVKLESILVARMHILNHAESSEFPRMFAEGAADITQWRFVRKRMETRIAKEQGEYRRALIDIRAYREDKGFTREDEFFRGMHRFHLDEQTTFVKYRACSLTICEFLELQPRALLKL